MCTPFYTYTCVSVCMHVQNTSEIWQLNCHSQISQGVFSFLFLLCLIHGLYLVSQNIANPDHWEMLEPSPARIREGQLSLECLRNLCVLPFLCHPSTNTNWPNKIYPHFHQFWLIYTPRPSGQQQFSASTEICFNCKVVTAFPRHSKILLLSLLFPLLYQPL